MPPGRFHINIKFWFLTLQKVIVGLSTKKHITDGMQPVYRFFLNQYPLIVRTSIIKTPHPI